MQPLDLRKFIWVKDDKVYIILAITELKEYNIVVYRESSVAKGGKIGVATVSDFMKDFTATYQLSN